MGFHRLQLNTPQSSNNNNMYVKNREWGSDEQRRDVGCAEKNRYKFREDGEKGAQPKLFLPMRTSEQHEHTKIICLLLISHFCFNSSSLWVWKSRITLREKDGENCEILCTTFFLTLPQPTRPWCCAHLSTLSRESRGDLEHSSS